jgi:hypothetical protein
MKMMFDGLNLPFELLNSRYGREAREREREREMLMCFIKHKILRASRLYLMF